ncbi:hypothetical protein Tcan_05908 [Toxocara canis]|uniref:Uncharacterized protein n=1 Tax=Toxocara canis TaxID=6265 RepID=A0A0B2VUU8_TOXCA|nr:hypothetical protein Tcan_05908 [Toxocara canis]
MAQRSPSSAGVTLTLVGNNDKKSKRSSNVKKAWSKECNRNGCCAIADQEVAVKETGTPHVNGVVPRRTSTSKPVNRKMTARKRYAKKVAIEDVKSSISSRVKRRVMLKKKVARRCKRKVAENMIASQVEASASSNAQSTPSAVLRRSTRTRRSRVTKSISPEQEVRQKRTRKTKSPMRPNTEQSQPAATKKNEKKVAKKIVWTAERRKQVGKFLSQQRVLAKLKRYGLDPETATPEQVEEKRREQNRLRNRKRKRKRDPEKQRAYRKLYMERMTPEQKHRYLALKRAAKARLMERKKAELLEQLEKKRRNYWESVNSNHGTDVVDVDLQKLIENFPKALADKWNRKKILTPEELEQRRQKERERHRRMRANYTPEQRAKRLEQNRQARKRAKERGYTDEQKAARRERNRRSYRRKMEALGRVVIPRVNTRKSEQSDYSEDGHNNCNSKITARSSKSFYSNGIEQEEEVRIILDDDENDDEADKPNSSKHHSCIIRRRKTHPTSRPDSLSLPLPATRKILRSPQPSTSRTAPSLEARFVTAVLRPVESESIWYHEVYDEKERGYRHLIEVPDDYEVLYMDYIDERCDALL